jgi:hypothetical protein
MIGRLLWLTAFGFACAAVGCGRGADAKPSPNSVDSELTPDQRDAQALGREVFNLVDQAVAFRGSHRGRPATTLREMGIESLTTTTVRRVLNIQREPVVTVSFRQAAGREIVSCRGDSQILVEASLNGRFTLMCTANSGAQRPMEVGEPPDSP